MTLVSGAGGFIGNALVNALSNACYPVVAASRIASDNHFYRYGQSVPTIRWHGVGDIGLHTDWAKALNGVTTVVHCAGRAHYAKENGEASLALMRRVNVDGTVNFARQAAQSGVKRFVYLSSIAVNGTKTTSPLKETAPPNPSNSYASSKLEAELALIDLATHFGMEYIIIRPPLVYGPDAPGNFGKLVTAVRKGVPLPFGSINNFRSFVALDNLISLLLLCTDIARSPNAANQVFFISDDKDISTRELIIKLSHAAKRPTRLIPVPVLLLKRILALCRLDLISDSLVANMQIDISKARCHLGWRPVVTMEEQLNKIFSKSVW